MMNGKRPDSLFGFPNIVELRASLKDGEEIIYDIETGYPYKVTKEYYEWYMKLWESARPKAYTDGSKPVGMIWITGTGGEGFSRCSNDARDMFYNPENYNLTDGEFRKDS